MEKNNFKILSILTFFVLFCAKVGFTQTSEGILNLENQNQDKEQPSEEVKQKKVNNLKGSKTFKLTPEQKAVRYRDQLPACVKEEKVILKTL